MVCDKYMSNFILVSHGSYGDVLPFLRLGEVLRKRGHKVTLVSHYIYKNAAQQKNINFRMSEEPEHYDAMIANIPLEADTSAHSAKAADFFRTYHGCDQLDFEYSQIESLHDSTKKNTDTLLIVRNGTSSAALLAAELLSLPVFSLVLAPGFISRMGFDNLLISPYILEGVNNFRKKRGLEEITDWLTWVSSPKKVFGTWPSWFASGDPDWHIQVTPVGFPVAGNNDSPQMAEEFISYLKKENPVCITGGTGKYLDKSFFKNCIEACQKIGKKALVVTTKGELLPEELPDSVRAVEHIPFESALPYMSLLIHHGGIGTLSEAYAAGIPQLILPKEMDRPDNAARVKQSGAGDFLPPISWNKDIIAGTLEKLLEPKITQRARYYKEKMKTAFTFEILASHLEDGVKKESFTIMSHDFIPQIQREKVTANNTGRSDRTEGKKALLARLLLKKRRTQ